MTDNWETTKIFIWIWIKWAVSFFQKEIVDEKILLKKIKRIVLNWQLYERSQQRNARLYADILCTLEASSAVSLKR